MPKVVASIEARMGSSRLPGKVLMDINGESAIKREVDRIRQCRHVDDIVLATTLEPIDDELVVWAKSQNLKYYRGSENDVLARVISAHRMMHTDVIVELTGDCPLLDHKIVDLGIASFLANDYDVVTNVRIPSYPQGADVQVFSFEQLADVERTIFDDAVREHVSLHFYENSDLYDICDLIAPEFIRAPDVRLQLDYPEDLEFIRKVYSILEPIHGPLFGVESILQLLDQRSDIGAINSHCIEKPVRS